MERRDKVTFLADPTYFSMAIIYLLIISISSAFVIILILHTEDKKSIIAIIAMWLINVIAVIAIAPKWLVIITMNREGIKYKAAFKRAVVHSYSYYPYIRRGGYFHCTSYGLMGYERSFIVMSRRRLSDKQLVMINNVKITEETIKIKYSKKRLKAFEEILPPKIWYNLKQNFKYELEH